MTYKILYEQSRFWLLRDWPEEPKLNMIDAYGDEREEKWIRPLQEYERAIEQCKANKILISNPELLPFVIYNNGFSAIRDIFDFPEGLKVITKEHCDQYHHHDRPSCFVAILSRVDSSSQIAELHSEIVTRNEYYESKIESLQRINDANYVENQQLKAKIKELESVKGS